MRYCLFLFVTLFIFSCTEPNVYHPRLNWSFLVTKSTDSIVDTLTLEILDKPWQITQQKMEWVLNVYHADKSRTESIIQTGVSDHDLSFPVSLFKKDVISLPFPPEIEYMKYVRLLPPPQIQYPIAKGNSIDWKKKVPNGYQEFEEVEVTGSVRVKDKIYFSNQTLSDSCWVLESYGKSSAGVFKGIYYFSEKYGFIYFKYDFKDYWVEIVPYEVIMYK